MIAAVERHVAPAGEFVPADFAALFETCFAQPFDETWWRWKYRAPRNPSRVLLEDGRIVAHYGGMPRPLSLFGEIVAGVQVGDVMVHPDARGLGRRGAFFAVASDFLTHELGYGRPHLLAYGFPNLRAMRVAELLKLYEQVDRIDELRWSAHAQPAKALRRLDAETAPAQIDVAWEAMRGDLAQWVCGVRDREWWLGRYARHPLHRYPAFAIDGGAVVIVRRHPEALEWIDFIGPLAALPSGRDAVRALAAEEGAAEAMVWASSSIAQRVRDADARVIDIQVAVPTGIWSPGPAPAQLRDRWFLLGGDADYR